MTIGSLLRALSGAIFAATTFAAITTFSSKLPKITNELVDKLKKMIIEEEKEKEKEKEEKSKTNN